MLFESSDCLEFSMRQNLVWQTKTPAWFAAVLAMLIAGCASSAPTGSSTAGQAAPPPKPQRTLIVASLGEPAGFGLKWAGGSQAGVGTAGPNFMVEDLTAQDAK